MSSDNPVNPADHDERGWFVVIAVSSYVAYAVHGAPAHLARITHGPGGTLILHPVGEPFARVDLAVDAGRWHADREPFRSALDPSVPTQAQVRDWFAIHRSEPEAVWTIDARSDTDPPLRLGITALGGGTVGRRYADNGWIYGLWHAEGLCRCGADLRSGSIGRTHHEMAVVLAESLTADDTLDAGIRARLAGWLADQPTGPDHG